MVEEHMSKLRSQGLRIPKKIKEYYLHGFQCTLEDWKEMKKERAGLPWYKNPSLKGTARL